MLLLFFHQLLLSFSSTRTFDKRENDLNLLLLSYQIFAAESGGSLHSGFVGVWNPVLPFTLVFTLVLASKLLTYESKKHGINTRAVV
jgi:hypothetical protein